MGLKLSILDQSPFDEGKTAVDAFRHTVALARKAEELGYHRFWVSEHHDSAAVAGSSPEVLIAYLLAQTERIRIGSGGVMLQHYSPYKVAENFNVLASLAPGRVDLGIGRAPGGLPRSTKALQQETAGQSRPLADKLIELEQYLTDTLPGDHPLQGLKAIPVPAEPADLYLLGTTPASAELAASRGIPYVFAQFINGDEAIVRQSLDTYRNRFAPRKSLRPEAILALSVIVADTDEEAKRLAADAKLVKIHLESGRTITVKTVEHAEEFGRQSEEKYTIEVKDADVVHGSKETVRAKLLDIQRKYGVDELILILAQKEFGQRLQALSELKEAFAESVV
ncbi:LLM class flavin-dependent oxidoreductase [Paenibacillus ehimensis]|uniref:LLM class flavin-dependent oxidoreductase n=1 Tax=Paenibacillus ehimensis TaxID=79264 RepID=A0ABT8V8Q3_9BACL|nr:LLM class flavin-dependent oxidoreductase [Paenibacillus ehimensis]MDO3677208.1 LLM class flavin-dependent oxidoreductase [Paenibacillus ehimensis]MEC0210747.1 LLM class flavin-dependent oxidoreductase [Paenibacillus ehimensis]